MSTHIVSNNVEGLKIIVDNIKHLAKYIEERVYIINEVDMTVEDNLTKCNNEFGDVGVKFDGKQTITIKINGGV